MSSKDIALKAMLLLALFSGPWELGPGNSAWAANDNAGTSGAAFLKITPGARPVAMGSAFTGLADDVDAIYWNPAGLARLAHPELEGMHMQYFQSIQYEYAAFAYPTEKYGTWGLAVTNLHTSDIQARTEDTDTPTGTFSAIDSAYWLSYAYPLTARLSAGGSLKMIRESIDSVNANAYAGDGGLLYDTGWNDLRLGASLQNLGNSVKFQTDSDKLPLTYRFGASAPVLMKRLLVSADLIKPRDNSAALALGGEYKGRVMDGLSYAIRSGYQTGNDVNGLSGVSAGAGLSFGRVSFDFAWVPFGELGNTYRYALHIKFGPAGEEETPKPNMKMQKASATGPLAEPPLDF